MGPSQHTRSPNWVDQTRPKRAFTLIELLVVIAIIALLVSILLPSLNRVRLLGKSLLCQTNLGGMGRALNMYTSEQAYYPGAHTWEGVTNDDSPHIVWAPRLRIYTQGEMDIFWCPVAPEFTKWVIEYDNRWPAAYGYEEDEKRILWKDQFCYGYNNWGTASNKFVQIMSGQQPQYGLGGAVDYKPSGNKADCRELAVDRVDIPAEMIAIGDSSPGPGDGTGENWDAVLCSLPSKGSENPDPRHIDKANILFCDAHVESLTKNQLVSADDEDVLRRWNNDNEPHDDDP